MVFDIDEDGGIREKEANILSENYWRISKVFSREPRMERLFCTWMYLCRDKIAGSDFG